MAAPNFTGDGQQRTLEDLSRSPDLSTTATTTLPAGLQGHLTFLSVLNSFLSVTAFLGNTLILIALRKESSLHPPSKLLLCSLATADLCVGLISEPLTVIFWMSVTNEQWNISVFAFVAWLITTSIFSGVSVGTLTAISVDRLLALLLGLRYRQVVTLKRTYVIVFSLWLFSAGFSATCFWNRFMLLWYIIIGISLSLIISIFSYTKIFHTLRQQNQVRQGHVQQLNQANQLNMARYKKAVSSAIWLQLTLVACYLPYDIVAALLATKSGLSSLSLFHAQNYTITLIYLNSSLNPILYCWKIVEVRQAVKDTIRQMLCYCFTS